MSTRPLARIVAKDKATKEQQITIMTVWPPGQYNKSPRPVLEAGMKVDGRFESFPVTVIVHGPDGDIRITQHSKKNPSGSHYVDYYEDKPSGGGGRGYGGGGRSYGGGRNSDFDDNF